MVKRHKKIPESLKSKILAEALVPGRRIADLAKAHGIAAWTIYTWRKASTAESSDTALSSSKTKASIVLPAKFVELSVESAMDSNLNATSSHSADSTKFRYGANPCSRSTLQKASLTFKHFSCALEGRINTSTLLKVIKAIDEEESLL